MIITLKYTATCYKCGKHLNPGTSVSWFKDTGNVYCYSHYAESLKREKRDKNAMAIQSLAKLWLCR